MAMVVAASVMASLTACAGGGFNGVDLDTTEVHVVLADFTLAPDRTSAPRGDVVGFQVVNTGAVAHDFLVVKTDLPADGLPTNPNGSYAEDGPGTEVVARVDSLAAGEDDGIGRDLHRGNYVLLSNQVGVQGADYALGMRAGFAVE